MTNWPKTYADSVLDDAFFVVLGRFVANCGHLEHVLWLLSISLDRLDVEDETDALVALQRSTRTFGELITVIKARLPDADDVPNDICEAIRELLGCISSNLVYRNLAIHGAWSSNIDTYKVSYINRITGEARDDVASYRTYAKAISRNEINDASVAVSEYLTRALQLKSALDDHRA